MPSIYFFNPLLLKVPTYYTLFNIRRHSVSTNPFNILGTTPCHETGFTLSNYYCLVKMCRTDFCRATTCSLAGPWTKYIDGSNFLPQAFND